MKLSYTLQFEDWEAFTLHVNRTVPSLIRARKISHFGLPIVYAAFGLFAGINLREWWVGGAMLALAFAWWMLYPKLQLHRTRKHLLRLEKDGAAKAILGDYELECTEIALEARISAAESRFPWEAFEKVTEEEGRTYLHLTPTKALVIPSGVEGGADFVAECRWRIG